MSGKDYIESSIGVTRCGDTLFRWGTRTYVMGIINLSPDSFSGDGCSDIEAALEKAQQMVRDGADIIDVGGESTRPGSTPIPAEEELKRVVPFLKQVARLINVPLSIDTYKTDVARLALDAGAGIINDISGLRLNPDLVKLAAERNVPIILTSNQRGEKVERIIESVINNLKHLICISLDAGVTRNNIIIDPGIGFGKTQQQNLEILRRLNEFKILQRPILIGASRKSVIGNVLDLPAEQRLEGTAATVAIGICKGADVVRVHDVKQMALVCRMSDAIVRGEI